MTLLILKCASSKCTYSSSFYSSGKVEGGQVYEVNRRVVLASRNIGVGHQGLAKFAGVMNMLPPMNDNSYRDHVSAVCNAAKTVAEKSMRDAVEEVKQFYEPEMDGICNIRVSGDGTWRSRGYSSAYGVVAALSTVTGKALNVEVMSKECRECMGWRGKEGTVEFQECWKAISIVAKRIIMVPRGRWMPLVCRQFSNVLWRIILSATLNFLGMGTVKLTN